jgi:hypothetical protein
MTPREFETYCFLRLYSIDLDATVKAIPVLRRYKKGDVQAALLRDIAVTYARPFSVNRGNVIPKHQLSLAHVPNNARALHKELIDLRNSRFAHTDLKFHDPKVARFGTKQKPLYPMSFKSFDSQRLLGRLLEVEALVKAVERSVNTEITRYEKRI